MSIKKYLVLLILLSFSVFSYAAEYYGKNIKYAYQRDDVANTEFEFRLTEEGNHSCGGTVYIVKSPSIDIASRKFSMVLAAVASGKKIDFGSNGNCSSQSRLDVTWVRLTNE